MSLSRSFAAAAALLCAAGAARAQPYDPRFRWRTIQTPHFRIHFHQGEEALAQVVARETERAHALLAPRLAFEPRRRTEVVLSDDSDDANGSATPLPYDTIRLYAVPPSSGSVLQDYRDWLRQVVQHEYAHILHLDRAGGVPEAVNRVFGKLWVPNVFLPPFFVEGVAVVNEAEGDAAAGRNASALFDMYARTLALDGPFPRLDQASNPYLEWPVGNVPYLLGGRFMGYLQARYGPEAIAGWIAAQARYVWPYAPSWAGEDWFGGLGFAQLWSEYAAAERAYAEGQRARVRERPVTRPAPVTRRGGIVENPRFSPDGEFLLFHGRSLDDRPGVFRVSPDGGDVRRVAGVDANGTLALRSPSEALVAIGEVWREYRLYDDLWLVDLRSGRRRRVTDGERATDPDVSADGRTAVYVRRTGAGEMALVRRDLASGAAGPIFARAGAQVFMPRLSRDGAVAFELHEGGRRDVAVWRDGRVARVTDDDALDTAPAWTPDGRFLLFASDRGGIYNLYAWEVATGGLRQVTNVETGAFQPEVSPDGKTLAFVTYGRAGYDLATIPLDEATWLEPSAAPPAPPAMADGAAAPLASRPYSPWATVTPTLWLPLYSSNGRDSIFGAFTGGADVLLRHLWAFQAWWDTRGTALGSGEPGYAFAYQGGWSWPRLDLSSSMAIAASPGPPDRLQRVSNYANAGLTFTWTRLARQLALRVGWSGTRYESVTSPAFPLDPVPEAIRFEDGFLSDLSLGAAYSDARRFVRSISPEEGRLLTVRLRVAEPEIGSDYSLARARAAIAQYVRIPFTRHGVLALRLSGGLAKGSVGGDAPFELGGVAGGVDVASLVPGAFPSSSSDQLRGYPAGALAGTGLVAANAELRFPLAGLRAGRSTWPVFLSRLHGALFLDAGDAFDRPGELPFAGHGFEWEQLRFSTGAELRTEFVLGYYLRTDLRVGVAKPLGALLGGGRAADRAAGIDAGTTFYVTVGPSF
ncbi:MAG TPA: BamA/TamA family outer membrane protein [Anaeromyxobacter sp.]|nr:BamA/TamA family outer membrane protein [Anaeromyxobacter sp.]